MSQRELEKYEAMHFRSLDFQDLKYALCQSGKRNDSRPAPKLLQCRVPSSPLGHSIEGSHNQCQEGDNWAEWTSYSVSALCGQLGIYLFRGMAPPSPYQPISPKLPTFLIIQLLPKNPRIIPPLRRLINVKMPRYIITIRTMIRDQHLDLLRSILLRRSTRRPTTRIVRVGVAVWCPAADDTVA